MQRKMTQDRIVFWIKRIVAVLISYGLLCALPFIIAPLVGAASAAALGYGELYETIAALASIILVAIWDYRRRKANKA